MATEGVELGSDELIKIIVKSPKDKKDIKIARTANVRQLKDIITKEFSAELEQLCLIYAGKILKDTDHLSNYGIKEGTTVHLVIKSANKAQDVAGSGSQQGSVASQPPINIGATPFGLGNLGGLLGLGNLGFGSANFMDLQQQMQREVFTNPEMLRNLLDNPMVRRLISNPALMQSLLSANPQMRELMQSNPEISRVLENPDLMLQAAEVARNPAMVQELMRNSTDGTPSDSIPRAFRDNQESMLNVASSASASASAAGQTGEQKSKDSPAAGESGGSIGDTAVTGAGVQSAIQQMIQNPQLMTNIMQAPYMQSMLQNLAGNPEIINQCLDETPLIPGGAEAQESSHNALPFLAQQLANPEVHSLMGNPRALQAMLNIQQSMQQLQSEAPGIVGGGGSGSGVTPASAVADTTNTTASPDDPYSQLLRQMFGVMSAATNPNQADQAPEVRYELQLNQLSSMGFVNRQANIIALSATFGDLNAAVDRLLQHQ